MLRTLEIRHLRRSDEILRVGQASAANWPTPYRSTIVRAVWLKDILLILIIGTDGAANIADGDGECSFPAWALGSWVSPLSLER